MQFKIWHILAMTSAMPRPTLYKTDQFPYHVVARSNNKDWFQLNMEECWEIFVEVLNSTKKSYEFETHAFLLMNNHYHWLLSTPKMNIDFGMRYFNTESSRKVARASGRINKIFGARYKPTVILEENHYINAFRYLYLNPIKAGICLNPIDYPWSTLHEKRIILTDHKYFGSAIPTQNINEWLMRDTSEDFFIKNQRALRRNIFKYPKEVQVK